MIRQVLANWAEKAAGRGLMRFAPLARQVLFARIAVTVLMVPSAVAAQAASTASNSASSSPRSTIARISDPTARAIELDLGAVFRTQRDNGAYAFSDAHGALCAHPLMATMSVDAYYVLGNKGTLSQAVYSIRYISPIGYCRNDQNYHAHIKYPHIFLGNKGQDLAVIKLIVLGDGNRGTH